jgi:hypothetical protein
MATAGRVSFALFFFGFRPLGITACRSGGQTIRSSAAEAKAEPLANAKTMRAKRIRVKAAYLDAPARANVKKRHPHPHVRHCCGRSQEEWKLCLSVVLTFSFSFTICII